MVKSGLPLIMAVYSYIDCTEGDINKLKEAVDMLCEMGVIGITCCSSGCG